jgi:hypothetical protein
MSETLHLKLHISQGQETAYFTLPFNVPQGIESILLTYHYPRRPENQQATDAGIFTSQIEKNVIDLGLIDPRGKQVGASGSDKTAVLISETGATPGYSPTPVTPGEWKIIVGAYKVASEGVDVEYEVTLTPKQPRWLKGDLHTHTLASDGVHTLEELAFKAKRNNLDFIAVTDHNQFVSADRMPAVDGVTMIPGVELTHYDGHANFTGVDAPFEGTFATNDHDEIIKLFRSAHNRGALITINHPFDPACSFRLDMNMLPFDCIEIWNGPMRESNLRAVGFWHQMLCNGNKIPAVGGSDYHRDTPFIFLGGPTTCVYANSAGKSDILAALRLGHCYISFAPNGPECELISANMMMGDSLPFSASAALMIKLEHLQAGDIVRVVTAGRSDVILTAPADGKAELTYPINTRGFGRVEVLRSFLPGIPPLPALITNPIYFD